MTSLPLNKFLAFITFIKTAPNELLPFSEIKSRMPLLRKSKGD
jgi:hypothetical protein